MTQEIMEINEYIAIVKRRKWSLILPALAVTIFAAAVALILPPVYKSTATILIEGQEVPDEFVKSSVTSYAQQRIQTIHQRIMSSSRLLEIINRLDLYPDLRINQPAEAAVAALRRDTQLEMINAEVVDPRSGRPSEAAIAFTLSYEGMDDARKVQQVATVLTSMFLEENLNERMQKTEETARFLEGEMNKVKASLDTLEGDIAAFKERNIEALPELLQVNIQNLGTTERSIELIREQLRSQKERESYLQTQLAGMAPQAERKARLDKLRVELVQLKSRFSDLYPDVVEVKAEIAILEQQIDDAKAGGSINTLPDNPAYVTLASQLSSTQAEIGSIKQQIRLLQAKSETYRQQIDNSPRVEEAYRKLISARDNTQAKYNDLMRKVMEARVSQGLEKEQKGERFTLIDPARLPEKPYKPNRLAILLIGMVLGVGAGVGVAALREFSDTSVRDPEQLSKTFGAPVLVTVPQFYSAEDLQRRKLHYTAGAVAAVFMVLAGLVVIHYQVMDLGVLWAKLMRKIV